MIFKSIRYSLQAWYAFLLLIILGGFGGVLFYHIRHAKMHQIDSNLLNIAFLLSGDLRPPSPQDRQRRLDQLDLAELLALDEQNLRDDEPPNQTGQSLRPNGEPPPRRPIGQNGPQGNRPNGPNPPQNPPNDGPPNRPPNGARNNSEPRLTARFRLRLADEAKNNRLYYCIWRPDGTVLDASPALAIPAYPGHITDPINQGTGGMREAVVPGPGTMVVLIGRPILAEQKEIRQLAYYFILTGLLLLGFGVLSGWWISGKVIRPIHAITATAKEISAHNLSRRIDISQTDTELGELAAVLNGTFSRIQTSFDQQVQFTADAAHELRTPLSIIYTGTELALSRDRSTEEYHRTLNTIFRAARRMKLLVEGLLVLARADAGQLEIKSHPVQLSLVVEDCIETLQPLATDKNIQLLCHLNPAWVAGDTLRLTQVVTNLIVNAINYNKADGKVDISVVADEQHIVLTIADTGIGISETHQQKLFNRFYRADPSRATETNSTGLGLAICQSIVNAHRGTITCKSKPNTATTFTVTLPRIDAPKDV